jgi:hypothetical protein
MQRISCLSGHCLLHNASNYQVVTEFSLIFSGKDRLKYTRLTQIGAPAPALACLLIVACGDNSEGPRVRGQRHRKLKEDEVTAKGKLT